MEEKGREGGREEGEKQVSEHKKGQGQCREWEGRVGENEGGEDGERGVSE